MSLIAWYPLNGNKLDYSGNDYHLYTHGTTSDLIESTNGKIGKCYEVGAIAKTVRLSSDAVKGFKDDCSMFCWINVKQLANTNTANGVVTNHEHTDSAPYGMGITLKAIDTNNFRVSCNTAYVGGGRTYHTYYGNTNLNLNKWYHIGFTYCEKTKKLNFYVNGKLDGTHTIPSDKVMAYKVQPISIFGWSLTNLDSANYRPAQKINDVRIYNEELSPKVINEISKGNILHYNFNKQEEPTTNLINKTYIDTTTVTSPIWKNNHSLTFIRGSATTSGIYIKDTLAASANTVYTLSYKIRKISGNITNIRGHYNDNVINIKTVIDGKVVADYRNSNTITNDWSTHEISFTFKTSASATNFYYLWIQPNFGGTDSTSKFEVWDIQLEKRDHKTQFTTSSRSGIICDNSGFGNNCILNDKSPSWNEDSGLGSGCYSFDSNIDQYMILPQTVKVSDEITVNVWAYKDNWNISANETLISCTESGGWNMNFNIDGAGKLTFATYLGAYQFPQINLSEIKTGWNMLTLTCDGRYTKAYLNGVLKSTIDKGSKVPISYNATNTVFLGAEAASNTTTPENKRFNGKISDVKIFATALNQEDISSMYKTKFSISNKGEFMANEFIETYFAPTLVDYSVWKDGQTGSIGVWSQNGATSENNRIIKDNPNGNPDIVWATITNDSTSDGDGGWNVSNISIDNTKKYRFTCWVRRENVGNGRTYWGCQGGVVCNLSNGTVNDNPYFSNPLIGEAPELQDNWCLFVGYIHPHTYSLTTSDSTNGIYRYDTKARVRGVSDFKWTPTAKVGGIRSYLFYSTSQQEKQFWYRPRFEVCDGNEPTIDELLNCSEHYPLLNINSSISFNNNSTIKCRELKEIGMPIRYIKDYLNGSNLNTGSHWVEIKAISNNKNVALGKTVTTNGTSTNANRVTNGNIDSGEYLGFDTGSSVLDWVQIDLGSIMEVDYVHVWHYHLDVRKYNSTKTEVSSDGKNWITIFDSNYEGTYIETAKGRISPIIKNNFSIKQNTLNANQFIEN